MSAESRSELLKAEYTENIMEHAKQPKVKKLLDIMLRFIALQIYFPALMGYGRDVRNLSNKMKH